MNFDPDTGKIAKIRSAGFFAKGVVYILVGALTFLAAIGEGGDVASTDGVVSFFLGLPLGKIIGGLVALGLIAYSIWRLYQAIFVPNGSSENGEIKNIFKRIRYFYSAGIYGYVAYSFAKPLIQDLAGNEHVNPSKNDGGQQAALGELLSHEWGNIVIWAVVLIVGIQALWQFKLAYSTTFLKKIDNNPSVKHEYEVIKKSGRIGYCARGIVFGIISFFLAKVVLLHNSNVYKGTEGALQYLLTFSYGSLLLGTTALGLAGYGIFNLMVARHANLTRIQ